MSNPTPPDAPALLLNDDIEIGLEDITRMCGVRAELIIEMVNHGVLHPAGARYSEWRFSSPSVNRVSRAIRLRRDLELNWPAVALAIELLDELHDLRRRHRALLQRLT